MIVRTIKLAPLILVVALTLAAPIGAVAGRLAPREGQPVVVIAAPWDSAARVATAASGQLILPGRTTSMGIAVSGRADFASQLRRAGAWLVLDGTLGSVFCGTT